MENKIIGIIGYGRYGQWMAKHFTGRGLRVLASDLNTQITNKDVVRQADVVIFCLPMSIAEPEIRKLTDCSRAGQLWLDITGIKEGPVNAMLASNAEVVGLHPMCAPTVETWRGQKVVYCPVRLGERWKGWVEEFLVQHLQADLVEMAPAYHDKLVSQAQALVHAFTLVMAHTLASHGLPMDETLAVASPFYRIALSMMGRILKQSPDLYREIQFNNPFVLELLGQAEHQLTQFRQIVQEQNAGVFRSWFVACQAYVGEENMQAGYDLFDFIIRLMADLSDRNSVQLLIPDDRPGLLAQLCSILSGQGINLTSFHSFVIQGKLRFWVGLDRPVDDQAVHVALGEIRNQLGLTCAP